MRPWLAQIIRSDITGQQVIFIPRGGASAGQPVMIYLAMVVLHPWALAYAVASTKSGTVIRTKQHRVSVQSAKKPAKAPKRNQEICSVDEVVC